MLRKSLEVKGDSVLLIGRKVCYGRGSCRGRLEIAKGTEG